MLIKVKIKSVEEFTKIIIDKGFKEDQHGDWHSSNYSRWIPKAMFSYCGKTFQGYVRGYGVHFDSLGWDWFLFDVQEKTLCNCNSTGYSHHSDIYDVGDLGICEECGATKFLIAAQDEPHDSEKYVHEPTKENWRPEKPPILITRKVQTLICKAFDFCGKKYPSFENFHYAYTSISVSKSDPTRLSGVQLNKIQKLVFDRYSVKSYWKADLYYANELREERSGEYLAKEGTYLKGSRLIKALAPDLTESEVTCIGSALADSLRKAAGKYMDQFEISDTPSDIYCNYSAYFDSCMQGESRSFFELYDMLPTISIVYAIEDNRLMARALLHSEVHVDGFDEPIKLMDRIYAATDEWRCGLRAWAKRNGYYHKRHDCACSDSIISPDDEHFSRRMHIKAPANLKLDGIPYLDTFMYYKTSGEFNTYGGDTTCNNTDGSDEDHIIAEGEGEVDCAWCGYGTIRSEMQEANGELICEECYDNSFFCEFCNTRHGENNGRYVDSAGEWVCHDCLNEHFFRCEDCNDYFRDHDAQEFKGESYCESCYEKIDDCKDCGEKTDQELDGDPICSSCQENYRYCEHCEAYFHTNDECECQKEEENV